MKKIVLVSLLLSAVALTSCSYINYFSSSTETSSAEPEPSSSSKPSVIINSTYENYVKNSVYYESAIPTSTPSNKYLVLPVWFQDSNDLINDGETKASILQKVSTAFSGTTEQTGWQSVKTYYETESLGKKTFDFVIADWYDCAFDSVDVAGSQDDSTVYENTETLIYDTINNYFKNHPEENRKDYDSDGDGYLDAVAIIYGAQNYNSEFPYKQYYQSKFHKRVSDLSNFWAYVYWFQNPDYQNVNYPGPNAYLWASYDFANVSSKNDSSYPVKVDAHAYIHETGHLFGLDDYYDYTGDNRPAGSFSMQDYNVGAHDPYSVLALGWGDIIVPEQTETITLKPFADTRQVILLSNNYQDSIFDEYLLLELYTPTGLNELDCTYDYHSSSSTSPRGPNAVGIRLWHVDARLAYKEARGESVPYSDSRITNQIDTQYYYNMLCRNNTYVPGKASDYFSPLAGRYNYAEYKLLQLIRQGDYGKFRNRVALEEQDLFTAGDSFDMSTYTRWFVERGKLNTGKSLGWSFTVDAVTSENATITVTKL